MFRKKILLKYDQQYFLYRIHLQKSSSLWVMDRIYHCDYLHEQRSLRQGYWIFTNILTISHTLYKAPYIHYPLELTILHGRRHHPHLIYEEIEVWEWKATQVINDKTGNTSQTYLWCHVYTIFTSKNSAHGPNAAYLNASVVYLRHFSCTRKLPN